MRSNTLLKDEEYRLANKLINICKRIRLESSITLYRGTTEKFNPIIGEKQFNALSPNLNTAETYGYYITQVIVATGSNAFYISAWELINTEVLLLPGLFTLYEEKDGVTTYLYSKKIEI